MNMKRFQVVCKVAAIRFSTLEAICKALNCQLGDIWEYVDEANMEKEK